MCMYCIDIYTMVSYVKIEASCTDVRFLSKEVLVQRRGRHEHHRLGITGPEVCEEISSGFPKFGAIQRRWKSRSPISAYTAVT